MSTRSGATGVGGRQMLPDKKPDRGAEPPSPDSPLRAGPLTRKRAASLRTDGPRIEDLHLSTPTDTSPKLPLDNGRDLICLCTPAPKVPRPRNGMCLFLMFFAFLRVCVLPTFLCPSLVQTQHSRTFACCNICICSRQHILCLLSHSRTLLRPVTKQLKKGGSTSWPADIRETSSSPTHFTDNIYPQPLSSTANTTKPK